jgi:phage-related protein
VFNGIGTVTGFLSDKGVDLARGLGEGIRTQLSSLRTRAREVLTTIGNGVGNVTGFLTSRGRDLINGMINGIGATIGTLRAKAGSLGREVLNAVGNTANMLVDAGKNIVIGLWNGIASLGSWLRSKVIRWIDDNVPAPIAWALKINSPSKVAASLGESVPEGLALGIDRGSSAVADAATRIANSALPALDSSAFSMGSLALSSTVNAPPPRMQVDWAPGANGDPVLDGLRNLIQVRYGGDVQTALGG